MKYCIAKNITQMKCFIAKNITQMKCCIAKNITQIKYCIAKKITPNQRMHTDILNVQPQISYTFPFIG